MTKEEKAYNYASDNAPQYPDVSWENVFEGMEDGFKAGAEYMLEKAREWLRDNRVQYPNKNIRTVELISHFLDDMKI